MLIWEIFVFFVKFKILIKWLIGGVNNLGLDVMSEVGTCCGNSEGM